MSEFRFLISRIDRIGDVVLSTPVPREIKKNFPNSFVSVLVKNYTKDIYFNNPYVDSLITYDNEDGSKKQFWQLRNEIKKLNFSHSFMLLPDERLNYELFLAGIPLRFGVGHKVYQFLTFTKYVNRKKYKKLRHEADYCLDMLRRINVKVSDINPEIFLTEEEKKKASIFKAELSENHKKIVGINISSGNSAPNLGVDEYKKLINELSKIKAFQIVVMDKEVPALVDNFDGVIYPNRGSNLRSSIINFSALDLLVSNSTGPMHIAAALKVPTISLFCPLTACSPNRWGPLGNLSDIILPTQIYCESQCPIDPKKCDYSNEGGLRANYILNRFNSFTKTLSW
jgi:ADP-heptose:LPS heptosyltransferase